VPPAAPATEAKDPAVPVSGRRPPALAGAPPGPGQSTARHFLGRAWCIGPGWASPSGWPDRPGRGFPASPSGKPRPSDPGQAQGKIAG